LHFTVLRGRIVPAACTDDKLRTVQSDTTFGSNANGRICGALLSEGTAIDAGSHDPDTAEGDTLVPVELTPQFYSPASYILVRWSCFPLPGS
jgi:hypothetical protein